MSNLAYTDDYKERFELIDGKIIMMLPRPRIAHSRALGNIFREFSIYLKVDILPMPKGRGFLDTNDTCLLK